MTLGDHAAMTRAQTTEMVILQTRLTRGSHPAQDQERSNGKITDVPPEVSYPPSYLVGFDKRIVGAWVMSGQGCRTVATAANSVKCAIAPCVLAVVAPVPVCWADSAEDQFIKHIEHVHSLGEAAGPITVGTTPRWDRVSLIWAGYETCNGVSERMSSLNEDFMEAVDAAKVYWQPHMNRGESVGQL
jgi:hypothetical protein